VHRGARRAAGGGTRPDFLFGERADNLQRRGGAVSESAVPTDAAEPPRRVRAQQSFGMRSAAREHCDRISRAGAAVAGNFGTRETVCGGDKACHGTDQQSETAAGPAEVGTLEQPPVARGSSPRSAAPKQEASSDHGARVFGMALRLALTAPPFEFRSATLRPRPTTRKRSKTKSKKKTLLAR